MIGIIRAAADLQAFCGESGWRFCFIGAAGVPPARPLDPGDRSPRPGVPRGEGVRPGIPDPRPVSRVPLAGFLERHRLRVLDPLLLDGRPRGTPRPRHRGPAPRRRTDPRGRLLPGPLPDERGPPGDPTARAPHRRLDALRGDRRRGPGRRAGAIRCRPPGLPRARAAVEAEQFDLIISDIGLPDGSGLDIMRLVRKRRPIKGIALSGFGMEEDIQRSREAGFSEHLTKPVDLRVLREAIRRLVEPE
jgi:CheY-like chemotaxis protein